MGKRRIDAPDTIDDALHLLMRLQSQGWGLAKIDMRLEYEKPHRKGAKLPVAANLRIKLEAGR